MKAKEAKHRLKILSHDYDVLLNSPGDWERNGMGRACSKSQRINLDKDMGKDTIVSTLYHEVIHIISDMNHLELSEAQVSGLSIGLFSVLKDNEALLESIKSGDFFK